MLKKRKKSGHDSRALINQLSEGIEKIIMGDDFCLFEEYARKNPSQNLFYIFQKLLNQQLSLYSSGAINLEQTNSALKEKNLGVGEPGLMQSGFNRYYDIGQTEKWIFGKEDLLMLFGCRSDPQYPYRLDYKLVFDYRNYRFSWLMDSPSLKVAQNRLFELKPSLTMRYINYGSFDLIRYKSPLEYPHRMLPSEFALPKSLLIDKIMLGKALMYEHLEKQLVLDKTLINIVMDCSQVFNDSSKQICQLPSKIKALGGVILDMLFYFLHALPHGQVDIRLIFFTPSDMTKKEHKDKYLGSNPDKFPLKLLYSRQWELESSCHKLTRQFYESKKLSNDLSDIISELKPLEGHLFSEWKSVKNKVKLSPQQEAELKKLSRFLPEILLGFHQLSREYGFNSTDFFLQHHSLCTSEYREELYKVLFKSIFRQESDQFVDDSGTLNVSPAYQDEFTQLFSKLSIARGEERKLKHSKTYTSQHVCLITTKCELENLSDWYNKSKQGDWDSLFHFEVSEDTPGLEFSGTDHTDHTHDFRKNKDSKITREFALEKFLKRIMDQMIFARTKGSN